MMSGSVSCGRYIVGVTYSRPLLRPTWCSRTSGAPSKFPPTLPSFARNSAMVFAFQSSGSLMSNCLSLGGDACCAGEMRRQELSGAVQRRGAFVEDRGIGLEDVRHPGGDVEGDRDVGGGGLPGEPDSVVEEDLVGPGLDDQWRQPGQVSEYRADQGEGG